MMNFTIENNILKGIAKPMNVDCKLGQLVLKALNENPDHVGQIDAETNEKTTYAQMKDRSIRCAVWMKKLAIRPDDIVVAVTHNHLDSYVPVFATFFVDAVFNAWNQNITLYSARRFMKMFTPKLIFACEKAIDVLIEAAKLEHLNVQFVVFGKYTIVQSFNEILDSQTKKEIDKFVLVDEKSSQDVASIMLSSGTTGFPKGVMLSHKSIAAMNLGNKPNKSSINMWYSTLDWVSCICFIFQTLFENGTRVISNRLHLESFLRTIEKYKVNLAFAAPILVNHLAKYDSVQNYNLQRATEAAGAITYKTPEMSKNLDSIGFVAPNCQVKIVDLSNGKELGANQQGEMHVKTPNIFIGYHKNPEATKQAIDEDGWYHTGDISYYDEEGEIFVVDRIKEIIKYRNNQISPAEIEEILLCHPEVREAAVTGIPHELDGDWPVAFVKKLPDSRLTKEDLVKLTSVLEDYKKLRGGIYFVDNLPRNKAGKIAKNELKQLARNLINDKSS